jgi:hypothetical protein
MSCASSPHPKIVRDELSAEAAGHCERVTIAELWSNPWPYAGRRVCISGYLGRMVSYGEDSLDLFASKEDAAERHSPQYLSLGVQMTLLAQKELASYSERRLTAVGTFEFDEACWPTRNGVASKFKCFPPRPMTIRDVELALGAEQ